MGYIIIENLAVSLTTYDLVLLCWYTKPFFFLLIAA